MKIQHVYLFCVYIFQLFLIYLFYLLQLNVPPRLSRLRALTTLHLPILHSLHVCFVQS